MINSNAQSRTPPPSAIEIERWLVALVQTSLALHHVDPERPLSDYGLSSVAAMRLLDELEQWLGESLPETLFFDHANVRAISAAVAAR